MRLSISTIAALATLAASRNNGVAQASNFCDLIQCTQDIAPVCASNNVSYDNACKFQIAKCYDDTLAIAATGKCGGGSVASDAATPTTPPSTTTAAPPKPSVNGTPVAVCEIMCMDTYQPVCGSDGTTYGNKCKLQLHNCNNRFTSAANTAITVASDGECAASDDGAVSVGPTVEAPADGSVAGADNNSTDAGAEDPARLCEMLCPTSYEPVCGSDGKTYSNACELRRAGCSSRVALTQVAEGECAGSDAAAGTTQPPPAAPAVTTPTPSATTAAPAKCTQMCPQNYAPVCGSDGKTYANACRFHVAKCQTGVTTMTITSEGECAPVAAESSVTPAPVTPAPVPAPSPPSALPTSSGSSSSSGAVGSCGRACTREYRPVCGSNGVTYTNRCRFEVAKCSLKIAADAMVATEGACAGDQ